MAKSKTVQTKAAEYDVLKNDLAVLEAMVDGMSNYLAGDVTWWDMGRAEMPLLTIGGHLMRRRRLGTLEYLLQDTERAALSAANKTYDEIVNSQIVRFEERALFELGSRIREWTVYLRDLAVSKRLAADTERYSYLADTRIVMGELVVKLSNPPFQLSGHIPTDIAALDNRMRFRWTSGAFIWSPVWIPAYPKETYWWLYGCPKVD